MAPSGLRDVCFGIQLDASDNALFLVFDEVTEVKDIQIVEVVILRMTASECDDLCFHDGSCCVEPFRDETILALDRRSKPTLVVQVKCP